MGQPCRRCTHIKCRNRHKFLYSKFSKNLKKASNLLAFFMELKKGL
ncbi:hypothetical protein HNR48_001923 [Pseudoteredinibacter isoporae]|uniref:Uncharacterized protein n=1 Tax=Pseudoteredinibacter isoporae TaxID=570281 RepID=A0A7X0JST0_9GAMM|nr:hypothetical protein [Pseudoteredinibacter isoporae]